MENNLLYNRWKERYNIQSDEIKKELDDRKNTFTQLQVIKRKRKYPEIGDVFLVNPKPGLYFWGVVLNNHISTILGDDLIVAIIFKDKITSLSNSKFEIDINNVLVTPFIVGLEYWTRGYFFNIDHIDLEDEKIEYGFYSVSKDVFLDEYSNKLTQEPTLLHIYGVKSSIGVGMYIHRELIIDKSLAQCDETLKLI